MFWRLMRCYKYESLRCVAGFSHITAATVFSLQFARVKNHENFLIGSGGKDVWNYSIGGWVLDTTRKAGYAADCPFHRTAWNYGKNGRPEVERMSQWAWMPSNCSSWARMDPDLFLRAVRGMWLGFVGESLNENFMVSLHCILSAADGRARKWKRRGAWRGAYFPSFEVPVGYHRAVLLSKFAKQPIGEPGFGSGIRVDIDVPPDATEFYDILVFITGWGHDKFPKESPLMFYKQGRPLRPPLSIWEGLAAVVKSTLDFIDDRVEEWFDQANGGVNSEERGIIHVIRSALSGRQNFAVMDGATMSEFRADAHHSLWLGSKDAHVVWGQDGLHWCLPGLPDLSVDMLSAIVLGYIEAPQ